VQALLEMELAALEPATSWARSSRSGAAGIDDLQGLYGRAGAVFMAGIAADIWSILVV
jgi:hypothetical protein